MFRDSAELSLTRQAPGMLPGWVTAVIALACLVTFVAVSLGVQLVWDQLPSWVELGWMRHGLTFIVTFWMLASFLPGWHLARMLRVAVLLPVVHVLVIALAWPAWSAVSRYAFDAAATPLARDFPFAHVVAGGLLAFAAIAGLVARRRSGEWVHGLATLALAELLLLGLWLPIASAVHQAGQPRWWVESQPVFTVTPGTLAFYVAPPTLAAIAFTWIVQRSPGMLRAHRRAHTWAVGVLLVVAVVARVEATSRMLLAYTNMLPLLLAAALIAIAAVVVLGAVTLWHANALQRRFAGSHHHTGIIVDDDEAGPVLGVEITSWLRGPRIVQRPFSVATRAGALPVRGAHLVTSWPPATTQLRAGECLAVLSPGDDVQLAGIANAAERSPFRTSSAPVADRALVAPAPAERGGFGNVALVLWRPCVAYLLIVSSVALPALAALLAM